MMNNQINMLKEKSISEYHTIAASLVREIALLSNRSGDFSENINTLMRGYARFYAHRNISLDLQVQEQPTKSEISLLRDGQNYTIFITNALSDHFSNFRLDYRFDISDSIAEVRNIQRVLLVIAVVFSGITAGALYLIVKGIFKPLLIVANASKSIANGHFGERIKVQGRNELATMAGDFNRMAEEIEKYIQAAENETERKQQFVDNLAHEMRNPLTTIYGYAEYIQKVSMSEEEMIESAEVIMNESTHMRKIADSLLELAILRDYKPVKKEILISSLFEDIRRALSGYNIQFTYNSYEKVLFGQDDLIKSLILNLCSNAIKACPKDGGIISVEIKKHTGNMVLTVTDNGVGIPKESLSKLTEPFYRVDKARNRSQGGAGLGLSLCEQIAKVHDATMLFESEPDIGTTVTVTFTTP